MFAEISSKTLKRFFETSPVPLTLSSPVFDDCPLVLVNKAFEDLSGYAADEIIGRNCRFLQGVDTTAESRALMRAAIEQRTETLVPVINYRKDQSPFENYVFLLPIFSASGALLYVLGSQCDVSSPTRRLTPMEHARLLDDGVALSNPALAAQERLQILTTKNCTRSVEELADVL